MNKYMTRRGVCTNLKYSPYVLKINEDVTLAFSSEKKLHMFIKNRNITYLKLDHIKVIVKELTNYSLSNTCMQKLKEFATLKLYEDMEKK